MNESDREMLTVELAQLQGQDHNYDRAPNEDTFEVRERYARRLRRNRPEAKSKTADIENPEE